MILSRQPPTTIAGIQDELLVWGEHNFGRQEPHIFLLGIIEETGEIARAVLKTEQGIRGTKESHRHALYDAIGDTMIFVIDFCNSIEYRLGDFVSVNDTSLTLDRLPISVAKISSAVGRLCAEYSIGGKFMDRARMIRAMHGIVLGLIRISRSMGWDLADVTAHTWEHVRRRDWKAYPIDGIGESA